MDPAELTGTVMRTVRSAAAGELGVPVPGRVVVERPRPGGRGDYATNAALRLAHAAGRDPLDVAALLRERLAAHPGIADVTVTGPGFLNIVLRRADDLVERVLDAGASYGHGESLRGYVVALDVAGHLRAAVHADVLRRLLAAAGASVADDDEDADVLSVSPVPLDRHPAPYPSDAVRWALLRTPAHERPRLRPQLLVRRETNPLFRIQYAHARAAALGVTDGPPDSPPDPTPDSPADRPAPAVRHTRSDGVLRAAIGELPAVVETAARRRAPDRLARHLDVLADAFLGAEAAHPAQPRGDEEPTAGHRARLRQAAAARVALRNGLGLLGIRAPEHI